MILGLVDGSGQTPSGYYDIAWEENNTQITEILEEGTK
jgi:hypothetical protein